ncbi:MAG: hypothetical protein ACK5AZ_21260 [Bryobacteraceae bacterium]
MPRNPFDYPRHLSDEEILKVSDGELPAAQLSSAREHLELCWTCRAKAERLRQAVLGFIEYRDAKAASLGGAPNQWSGFRSRLAAQSSKAPVVRPHGWLELLRVAGAAFTPSRPRLVAAGAVIAILGMVLLTQPVPGVSAGELLDRAGVSEARRIERVVEPVVYQKLHLRSGADAATGEFWRMADDRRFRDRWSTGGTLAVEFKTVYARNNLDFRRPLSPVNHARWRHSLASKSDRVVADRARRMIQLETVNQQPAAGQIAAATLTFRESDLHPVEQTLLVRADDGADREYRLTELSYEVLPLSRVPLNAFDPHPSPSRGSSETADASPRIPESAAPAHAAPAELDLAEARVRELLRYLDADIQETPSIVRERDAITVRADVDSVDRQREISEALRGLPFVRAEVSLPALAGEAIPAVELPAETVAPALTRTTPPFAAALRNYAGGIEPAHNFLAALSDAMRPLRVEVLALQRLAARYPDSEFNELAEPAREIVDRIAKEHLMRLRAQHRQLETLLSPVIDDLLARERLKIDGESQDFAGSSWRVLASRLASEIRNFEETLDSMFVQTLVERPVTLSGEALLRETVQRRAAVNAILRELAAFGEITPDHLPVRQSQ